MRFRFYTRRYNPTQQIYRYFFTDENNDKWVVGSPRYRYFWEGHRMTLEEIYERIPEMTYIEPFKHKGTLDTLLVVEEPIRFF